MLSQELDALAESAQGGSRRLHAGDAASARRPAPHGLRAGRHPGAGVQRHRGRARHLRGRFSQAPLARPRHARHVHGAARCGVANPQSRCRCTFQINHNVARGRLAPRQLRFALPVARTSLEALRAHAELGHVRRSLELYRAQPSFSPGDDFAAHLRTLITQATALSS